MSAPTELQTRVTRGAGQGVTLYAFQHELKQRDKRAAVDVICATFPSVSRSWAKRHLPRIQTMDGAALAQFIACADPVTYVRRLGWIDPTGDTAARNVDRERRTAMKAGARA